MVNFFWCDSDSSKKNLQFYFHPISGTAYLKTIEVYDPETNQWRLCGCMNYRRLGGGVGVMVVRAMCGQIDMW